MVYKIQLLKVKHFIVYLFILFFKMFNYSLVILYLSCILIFISINVQKTTCEFIEILND